ncbi:ABC transporter substrate-binding protein [Lentisphaera marina]|uniref:ABC transporter substrate-binding protein n=1 Tax=Lentisphaera marina TaxID=1111041 RepID=UPI0023655770|nr:ABC transporter substrate-binding protein [Lentisphaera marina]MDD7985776.1 ABC transporter substrate-binding protein [Lentisphaera marina]
MRLVGILLICFLGFSAHAEKLKIYIDADFSNYYESSRSIEVGILSSLHINKHKLSNNTIEVIRLDHRGNNRRSLKNLKIAAAEPNTLAVFCGMHSPPVLANQKFINDNKILLLNPWAAAAPITRSQSDENYIFRLSLDDSTVGKFLIQSVANVHSAKKPYFLLEDTAWGKNNWKTLSAATNQLNIGNSGVSWFKWNLSDHAINEILLNLKQSDADSIILVGNANESSKIVNAISESKLNLPIVSHWGITGGDFYKSLTPKAQNYPLLFIQSSFDLSKNINNKTLQNCAKLFPNDFDGTYIKAPSGFVHAYDLTSLLLEAGKDQLDKRRVDLREAIKIQLEQMNSPVHGLLKKYQAPFSPYTINTPFSHEALRISDYRLAFYNEKGQINHRNTPHD